MANEQKERDLHRRDTKKKKKKTQIKRHKRLNKI